MDYLIAKHRIRLTGEGTANSFARALQPFRITSTETDNDPILTLETGHQLDLNHYDFEELDSFLFEDADADCHFGRHAAGYLFYMTPHRGGAPTIYEQRYDSTVIRSNVGHDAAMYRFGLWMMYGLATIAQHTVAVHSSVIRWGNGAVMFLGESGTGKSTHTRLWREHITGAELLNDDSPIVRLDSGIPTVYGSPWSGKTPCYRNEHYPIRAIVRLSQAPHNRITRLSTLQAIGALLPSCPPAFAYDARLQDQICTTLSEVIASVPVYHLECLPDADAARLSFETIFGPNKPEPTHMNL